MAQNITLPWAGASYSNVPAVMLPKTGGGMARFDDTTDADASAADIATGKTAYVNGEKIIGTNAGGITNVVQGVFATSATTGAAQTLSIDYSGNGFPIAAMIYIDGGAYNNTETGNATWYNSTQRYAVGQWTMHKSVQDSRPTFGTSGSANQCVTTWVYKNSTSTATTYSRSSAMNTNALTSSNATGAGATCVRFKGDAHTISYYVASSSYGLMANTKYKYIIIYSS